MTISDSQENANTDEQTLQRLRGMIDALTVQRNSLAARLREFDAGASTDLQAAIGVLRETMHSIETALPAMGRAGDTAFDSGELVMNLWDTIGKRQQTVSTGFRQLDDILSGGFEPLRLVGLLGAPNCGKTTFAHQMAEEVATRGRPVLYVTSEDTPTALLSKSLARLGRVKYSAVLKGWENEREKIDAARALYLERGSSTRLRYLDATNGVTMEEIRDEARTHFARFEGQEGYGPGLIVIDYLQRIARGVMSKLKLTRDLREVVSMVTDQSRAMAYDLGCTVVAIASQNRGGYTRGEQGSMASAKESGDIEYTVDVLMALGEDQKTTRNVPVGHMPIKLYMDKNRQGQRGKSIDLDFWPDRQQFASVEE